MERMTITICVGSSCHLKGSRQVVEKLQEIAAARDLAGRIELCGAFCMGNCTRGVAVRIGDEVFSVQPETVRAFFDDEVMPHLSGETEV